MSVGPPSRRPSTFAGSGARARPSSSKKIADSVSVAPRPPYSTRPVRRPPSRPRAAAAGSRAATRSARRRHAAGSGPGSFAANQARSSSRKAGSRSEKVRSIRAPYGPGSGHGATGPGIGPGGSSSSSTCTHSLPQTRRRPCLPDGRRPRDHAHLHIAGSTCPRSPRSRCSTTATAARCCATTSAVPRDRARAGRRVRARHRRPGARTPTGARSSATTPPRSSASTATRSRSRGRCAHDAGDAPAPILVNGVIGPRGDGYVAGAQMSASEAEAYHALQAGAFAAAGADMVAAITMTYVEEAIGVARAAAARRPPGGDLVHGRDRRAAAERPAAGRGDRAVDAETPVPAYYMVNCAHPTHFAARPRGRRRLARPDRRAARERVGQEPRGARRGDGARRGRSRRARGRATPRCAPQLPERAVLGGCCGTDARHVAAAGAAWTA